MLIGWNKLKNIILGENNTKKTCLRGLNLTLASQITPEMNFLDQNTLDTSIRYDLRVNLGWNMVKNMTFCKTKGLPASERVKSTSDH